jgi:periplasmic protein TonB
MSSEPERDLLWSIGTLVVWGVCVAVGAAGLCLGYPRNRGDQPANELPPTQIIDAKLTPEAAPPPQPVPAPPPEQAAPVNAPAPAAAPPPPDLPASPPVVAVAPPSPAISFALPTEGLTRVVDVSQAGDGRSAVSVASVGTGRGGGGAASRPAAPPTPAAARAPAITRLSLSEGDGLRIVRNYPDEARLAHQEGTVAVRFTVEEDGHVSSAQVISPSRWPILNQGAVRDIRQSLFAPGERRIYEVSMVFKMDQ